AQHRAVASAFGRAGDAAQRRARTQPANELEHRRLPFPQHDAIESAELEHELRLEGGLHTACNDECAGCDTAGEVCELEIEAQRHARRRDSDDVPRAAGELLRERQWRWSDAAVRVEYFRGVSVRLEHTRKPPYAEGWREKRVLAAVRIVRADQQDSWRRAGLRSASAPFKSVGPRFQFL